MSLIYIVDKLEEVQLQDRLTKAICNLQNDPEASIRTNATIFLGKIAIKLKDSVRHRILSNAFVKSMKDNFLHCRY
jgi:SCY1-like protein 1